MGLFSFMFKNEKDKFNWSGVTGILAVGSIIFSICSFNSTNKLSIKALEATNMNNSKQRLLQSEVQNKSDRLDKLMDSLAIFSDAAYDQAHGIYDKEDTDKGYYGLKESIQNKYNARLKIYAALDSENQYSDEIKKEIDIIEESITKNYTQGEIRFYVAEEIIEKYINEEHKLIKNIVE